MIGTHRLWGRTPKRRARSSSSTASRSSNVKGFPNVESCLSKGPPMSNYAVKGSSNVESCCRRVLQCRIILSKCPPMSNSVAEGSPNVESNCQSVLSCRVPNVARGVLQVPPQGLPSRPGGNPGANGWFLWSTPIQVPPRRGGICDRLT